MNEPRKIFKRVKFEGSHYLYPFPVIKGKKYLLKVHENWVDFFIFSFKEGFLNSIDEDSSFINQAGVHTDGNTIIYDIDFDQLHFKILKHRDQDLEKAQVIEALLSKKIKACLKEETGALLEFKKSLEKQKQCSTCQQLGILEERIDQFEGFFLI